MRRVISMISSVALAAAALGSMAACSKESNTAQSPKENASLTLWADDKRAPELEGLVKEFSEQTKIDVKIVLKSVEDMDQEFISQVPTGKGPDLIVMAHDKLGALVKNGVVATFDMTDKASEFAPAAISAVTYDGQTYGVPYAIESVGLIRNTDMAAEAPKTYDDMIAAGKGTGAEYPFVVQQGEKGDPYHLYPFQTSFEAPVFHTDSKGSYTSELSLGEEGGLAFANWLAQQGKDKNIETAITPDIAKQAFIDKKTPFMITGPWSVNEFKDAGLNIAVSDIPAPGPKPAQPFVGVQAFFASAKSNNAVGVAKFLEWVSDSETQTKLTDIGKRLPARTAAAEKISDPIMKQFAEVAGKGVPMPALPEMGKVWDFWGDTEANIITGAQDPATAWNSMVENIKKAISQ